MVIIFLKKSKIATTKLLLLTSPKNNIILRAQRQQFKGTHKSTIAHQRKAQIQVHQILSAYLISPIWQSIENLLLHPTTAIKKASANSMISKFVENHFKIVETMEKSFENHYKTCSKVWRKKNYLNLLFSGKISKIPIVSLMMIPFYFRVEDMVMRRSCGMD